MHLLCLYRLTGMFLCICLSCLKVNASEIKMHLGPHSLFRGGELHIPDRHDRKGSDRKGLKRVGL